MALAHAIADEETGTSGLPTQRYAEAATPGSWRGRSNYCNGVNGANVVKLRSAWHGGIAPQCRAGWRFW